MVGTPLLCPFCRLLTPIILSIGTTLNSKKSYIELKCKCKVETQRLDLQKYLEYLASIEKKNNPCFLHKNKIGKIYCKACDFYMCEHCFSYHLDFEPSHENSFIGECGTICAIHNQEINLFYCKDCATNFCKICRKNNHIDHKIINLAEWHDQILKDSQFKSIDELNTFISSQTKTYAIFIKDEIDKIDKTIISLKKMKNIIEQVHFGIMMHHQNFSQIIQNVYLDFFKSKNNFNAIQNFQKFKIHSIIDKDDYKIISKIFDSIAYYFKLFIQVQNEIAKRLFLKEVKNDLNEDQFILGVEFPKNKEQKNYGNSICEAIQGQNIEKELRKNLSNFIKDCKLATDESLFINKELNEKFDDTFVFSPKIDKSIKNLNQNKNNIVNILKKNCQTNEKYKIKGKKLSLDKAKEKNTLFLCHKTKREKILLPEKNEQTKSLLKLTLPRTLNKSPHKKTVEGAQSSTLLEHGDKILNFDAIIYSQNLNTPKISSFHIEPSFLPLKTICLGKNEDKLYKENNKIPIELEVNVINKNIFS